MAGEKTSSPDHERKMIESEADYSKIWGFDIRIWLRPTVIVGPPTDVVGPPGASLGLGFAHFLSEKLIEGNVIIA